MACLTDENRVVIHDLKSGGQKEVAVLEPMKCAASPYCIALTTAKLGLHLFTHNGELVQIFPRSKIVSCAAFLDRHPCILATGLKNGSLLLWDMQGQHQVYALPIHTSRITSIRSAPDGRLYLSSYDNSASVIALNSKFKLVSRIKLDGHTNWVNDILPLSASNQCVTCSNDKAIKVWDSGTGACLRTLTEHLNFVMTLAHHHTRPIFASGSYDQSAIIRSSESFEVLHSIQFPSSIQSLVFGEDDSLYVEVYDSGVMSCNPLTGEIGAQVICGEGTIHDLAIGMT